MATATVFDFTQGQHASRFEPRSGYATIDSGETATLPIPCHGRALVRLGFPNAFTGTTVTFTVQAFPPADPAAPTVAPVFRPLYDDAGNQVTVTATDNSSVEVPELSGCYAFTIVSSGAEGAARSIEVQMVGEPSTPGLNKVTLEGTTTVTANQGTQGSSASPWWTEEVPQSGATNALTNVTSTAAEASHILKASAGRLYGMTVESSAAQFIQLFNSATLPADAVVPVISFDIGANQAKSIDFGLYGRYFSAGIVVSNSSTGQAKTIGGSTIIVDAQLL